MTAQFYLRRSMLAGLAPKTFHSANLKVCLSGMFTALSTWGPRVANRQVSRSLADALFLVSRLVKR